MAGAIGKLGNFLGKDINFMARKIPLMLSGAVEDFNVTIDGANAQNFQNNARNCMPSVVYLGNFRSAVPGLNLSEYPVPKKELTGDGSR